MSYRTKSDDFEPKVITKFTEFCGFSHCRVFANYKGGTMMGGQHSYYNKNGIKIIHEPYNAMIVHLHCQECGKDGTVDENGNARSDINT